MKRKLPNSFTPPKKEQAEKPSGRKRQNNSPGGSKVTAQVPQRRTPTRLQLERLPSNDGPPKLQRCTAGDMLAISDEELLEECFTALGMAVTGPNLAPAGQNAGAASSQQGTASVSPVSKLQDPTTQLYPEVPARSPSPVAHGVRLTPSKLLAGMMKDSAHKTRHQPGLAPSDLLPSSLSDSPSGQKQSINTDAQQAAAGSTVIGTSTHGQGGAQPVASSSSRMESQGPAQQRQQGSNLLNALLTIDID